MAAVTIHGDFRAQENKICHFFHFFTISPGATTPDACGSESFLTWAEANLATISEKTFAEQMSSKKGNWGMGWGWFNPLESKLFSCFGWINCLYANNAN